MNNIYLVPNDDGTYEAFAAPVAPAENAALLVLGQAQSQAQVGIGIHVGSQNSPAFVGIESCQGGGQCGLAHAALTGNRKFHWKRPRISNVTGSESAREFSAEEGLETEDILCVFRGFQSAPMREKIR